MRGIVNEVAMEIQRKRVVIIGAGFGGIFAAQQLDNEFVDVLLIDRNNYHTFTPLLYQVATSGLEPGEIAYPVRGIFRDQRNLTFLMGEVTRIDTTERVVEVKTSRDTRLESYDTLIVAAGSISNYFNTPGLEEHAFELKTLSDAVNIRNHVLKLFERAVWTADENLREALTTIVVVGGGPTGLEMAGAMHELYSHVLKKEYPHMTPPRVILAEAANSLLLAYPEHLREAALRQAQSLGVEVELGSAVQSVEKDKVYLKDGRIIASYTVIWSAGVKASPLAEMLGVPLQRAGRVPVAPTMKVLGLENVYVVGDMAYLEDENGRPYPMLIPVAKQQAILVANNILRDIQGADALTFKYNDRGTMATIGRSRAVAMIFNRIPLTGMIAWISWLALHLVTLMGFRNRLTVLINWLWNYLTYDRSMRIILEMPPAGLHEQHQVQPVHAAQTNGVKPMQTIQSGAETHNAMEMNEPTMSHEELLQRRDDKARPHLEQYAPVWITEEKIIDAEDAVVFNAVFQHPLYGWVNRCYRFDGFNNVLYHKGQTLITEDEAVVVQGHEPYIVTAVMDIPNAYGG
jgi:NADH dehydrogenase